MVAFTFTDALVAFGVLHPKACSGRGVLVTVEMFEVRHDRRVRPTYGVLHNGVTSRSSPRTGVVFRNLEAFRFETYCIVIGLTFCFSSLFSI